MKRTVKPTKALYELNLTKSNNVYADIKEAISSNPEDFIEYERATTATVNYEVLKAAWALYSQGEAILVQEKISKPRGSMFNEFSYLIKLAKYEEPLPKYAYDNNCMNRSPKNW